MPVGERGILRTALLVGLALGAMPAEAQQAAPASSGWTDPPPRGTTPAARSSATPAKQVEAPAAAPEPAKPASAQTAEIRPEPAAAKTHRPLAHREPRRARTVVEAPARRQVDRSRVLVMRDAVRPRRSAGHRTAPRFVEVRPYPLPETGLLPVGRVAASDGRRMAAFDDDRANRLAAAQAAGYLVVRARSVRFPDGRVLRTYRPYEDDGLED